MPPPTLLTLPAELRNTIYELAFTHEPGRCYFRRPKPPLNELLICCRQIQQEAKGLHHRACRQYFASTHFVIDQYSATRDFHDARLTMLKSRGLLDHVQHLKISFNRHQAWVGFTKKMTMRLVDSRGVWKVMSRTAEFFLVITPNMKSKRGAEQGAKKFGTQGEAEAACAGRMIGVGLKEQILAAIYLLADWYEGASLAAYLLNGTISAL